MDNLNINKIMDEIDSAKERNAINDLSVIAYRLVNLLVDKESKK